ncbi:MAG TPA: hypothetical protein VEP48_11065 [Methylomirabilota bacterium]|nr:hypothetical protein [Methylomirabilota bacterium]
MRSALAVLFAAAAVVSCTSATTPPSSAITTSRAPRAEATADSTAAPSVAPEPIATATPSPTALELPRCRAPAGSTIRAFCPTGARIVLDPEISDVDAAAIVTQVTDDLAAVQREFEWTLRGTPQIDVYATRDRFVAGLTGVFGYSRATAEFIADNSVAFFEPSQSRIAVFWEAVRDRRPIAAMRHELTHIVTLEACVPRCDLVPAWLNEGQARLAEALIPGADWRLMRVRFEAASMVTSNSLMPLTSLWTQAQWNAIGDWAGYYKYQEAARATELMRTDIGDRAIPLLYSRIRSGIDVARAYTSLTGKSFESFISALPSRLQAIAGPGPGIVATTPGADGQGPSFLLYGFPPETHLALRLRARHSDETQDIAVSPQGAYFGSIDDGYAPGAYVITATANGITVLTTVTKRGGRTLQTRGD